MLFFLTNRIDKTLHMLRNLNVILLRIMRSRWVPSKLSNRLQQAWKIPLYLSHLINECSYSVACTGIYARKKLLKKELISNIYQPKILLFLFITHFKKISNAASKLAFTTVGSTRLRSLIPFTLVRPGSRSSGVTVIKA